MQNQVEPLVQTMTSLTEASSYVTRQDILNFPFPYKLWLVVHMDFCDFLRWNRDGTVILLDLVALEDYLNSTRSIFKIKNRSTFLEHLEQFKFDRLNATPEAEEDLLLQYKNENFQRHRLDLLAKIRRHTYQLLGNIEKTDGICGTETAAQLQQMSEELKYRQVADRMLGDLCFMSHGGLSKIQKSRLRFQTVLGFQNETRILEEKLQASDEYAAIQAQQRRLKSDVLGRTSIGATEEEQVIELPVDLFENPHDSVLHLGDDFRPEYAGYYGNCSKDQVLHFFGDYLPMYEDGSMEVKKILAEICPTNQHTISSNKGQLCMQAQIIDSDYSLTSTLSESISQQIVPTLNLSSTLEPIFKNDEEEDVNNNLLTNDNNGNICSLGETEAEISMDDFIKFKSNIKEDIKINCAETGKDFPQMPAAVKMEIADESDSENEANFRNFFSQYRASLNLLYERH
ncbi:uncharacterized protein LOC128856871 [Anastrepha ludens]|uniref:uncharacterized protein LOC128856871 n=1 Tax=Anastrepha ludens TaxID=28586 RepID=UPI0023B06E88|nr:uncharacterized protein LOC128856871 [Anastrepha ludens]